MMSWFASDFFARSPALAFPLVALFLFITVFATVSLRVALTRKAAIDRLARLPLANDDPRPSSIGSEPPSPHSDPAEAIDHE